jgi:hypothetical protein
MFDALLTAELLSIMRVLLARLGSLPCPGAAATSWSLKHLGSSSSAKELLDPQTLDLATEDPSESKDAVE